MSTPSGNDPNQYGQGQEQYGQNPYPQAQYGAGAPTQAPKNGMGITALVLGIIAIVTFWTVILGVVLGLLAIIFGIVGLSRANKGVATNKGVAIAGIVTGALGLIGTILYVVLVGAAFLGIGGGDYISCLQQAGQNQSQIQQCQQQFQNQVQQSSNG